MFSSSRNNPIPREDEPNLHPAALNFTTMKRALESEVAEERPQRLTVCVSVRMCVWESVCYYMMPKAGYPPCVDLPHSPIFKRECWDSLCFLTDTLPHTPTHTYKWANWCNCLLRLNKNGSIFFWNTRKNPSVYLYFHTVCLLSVSALNVRKPEIFCSVFTLKCTHFILITKETKHILLQLVTNDHLILQYSPLSFY